MKQFRTVMLFMAVVSLFSFTHAQENKGIQWTGEDEIANDLAIRGAGHWMNIEMAKARTFFQAAIDKDPSLFAPHVVLAILSGHNMREHHTAKAKELVKDKNEVSQLFVSMLDVERGKGMMSEVRTIWAKMHNLAPEGRLIHFYYAMSQEEDEDRIAELEKLLKKNEERGYANGHVHNILGYSYNSAGDTEKAKMHFEKYLELNPTSYNAYDSMGEFYMVNGDNEKALGYYKKAKAIFPPSTNATNKIKELETAMSDMGNLVLVSEEHVSPENIGEFMEWSKDYKAVADKTGYETFYVSSSDGVFSYASVVGKTMADVDAHRKGWQKWIEANPSLGEQYEKHHHTISHIKRSLWRHNPKMSYTPKNVNPLDDPGYIRVIRGYIKFGHREAVDEIMAEFKKTWEEAGVSQPYGVYWNVFGEDGACVAVRSVYKDATAWAAGQKEVQEKVGMEKLNELQSRWVKHMRHWDNQESYPVKSLTHIKQEVQVASSN